MDVGSNIQWKRFWAQLFFLAIPSIAVAAFLLWRANSFFSILSNQWIQQIIYFGAGLLIALLFYVKRFRFLSTFGLLILLFFIAYKFLDNLAVGEFDAFFISKKFLVFAILFSFGWLCGWGFQRVRFYPILLACLFFLLGIYLISKTGDFNLNIILYILLPITFSGVYLVYAGNEIYKSRESNFLSYRHLTKRLLLFLLLSCFVSLSVVYFMYDEIKEKIENYGGGESNEGNSMLKKNKDGTVKNQDKMPLKNNNKRTNDLVFCAYIDNFFDDMDAANPLYMNSFYFTKFDTLTETFERDSSMPYNDEFQPDPSSISLFSIYKEENKIDSSLSTKGRKQVEIEVYKKQLAKDAFLAPSTAYEVQPITVEKDYQQEFKYAYRAKSNVSELNSAYFIYNSENDMINMFQEQRFELLRKAQSYNNTPKRFFDYYTHFPTSKKFDNFKSLADSLSKNKQHTIDKVLAIREHFKEKNGLGEAVYAYSDNPGIPGLPGASKLSTFMFQTKKGWCTYYAGSTLLLLRAMKIPSRIAVGFMTVDRSDNNKGWYWFYQDQAHAWVQVYFPEYGWLDFDFTIGNDEAQQSPTPDGTPPLQPPNPVFATAGLMQSIDTTNKIVSLLAKNIIYNKKEFKGLNETIHLNIQNAKIWQDTLQLMLKDLKKGDAIMAVNYDPKYGKFTAPSVKELLLKLPKNIPIEEIYLKSKKDKETQNEKQDEIEDLKSWKDYLLWSILALLLILLLIFLLPYLSFKFFVHKINKSSNLNEKAYRMYRASTFYLNQINYQRNSATLLQFAKEKVDPSFNIQYERFVQLYLKTKYSKNLLSAPEQSFINTYWSTFYPKAKNKFDKKTRIKKFLNLNRYIQYFYLPKLEEANGRTT